MSFSAARGRDRQLYDWRQDIQAGKPDRRQVAIRPPTPPAGSGRMSGSRSAPGLVDGRVRPSTPALRRWRWKRSGSTSSASSGAEWPIGDDAVEGDQDRIQRTSSTSRYHLTRSPTLARIRQENGFGSASRRRLSASI